MIRRPLIVLPLALALAACVTIERDNTGTGGPGCADGQARCYSPADGADTIEKCHGGAWITQKTCGDSEVCIGEGHECRPGAGASSCVEVIECVNDEACVDDICYENCVYDGTSGAQAAFFGLYNCLETAGCADVVDPFAFAKCVIDGDCAADASSCLVGQAGDGTCADISRCLIDDCLKLVTGQPDVLAQCLLGCQKRGDPVGQTWFLWLQQCAKENCLSGDYVSCVRDAMENPLNPCQGFAAECRPDVPVVGGVPGA